jgi:hypothetical protein
VGSLIEGVGKLNKNYLLTLSCTLLSLTPCFAQDEIDNNQPVKGALNKTETRLQSKLTSDYNQGLINSDQLCQFQRDLDGILEHENEMQTEGGMNEAGKKRIEKDLSAFESNLDKAAGINESSKKAKTSK